MTMQAKPLVLQDEFIMMLLPTACLEVLKITAIFYWEIWQIETACPDFSEVTVLFCQTCVVHTMILLDPLLPKQAGRKDLQSSGLT